MALKIGRSELIEIGVTFAYVAYALIVLGLFEKIIDSLVFQDWLSARTGVVA